MKTSRYPRRDGSTLAVRWSRSLAFTIIEMMLAIGIFMMILISIYSIWSGIVKASLAARKAADMAQRGRVAMNAIESALVTAQMFPTAPPPQRQNGHYSYYSFEADMNNGNFGRMSFVAHLPATFPGVGRFGDNVVRRVTFTCESEKDGTVSLVMSQTPMLEANFDGAPEPYRLVLAKEVQMFGFQMWGQPDPVRKPQDWDWVEEWKSTNSLPSMMRIGLGLGKTDRKDKMQDLVVKVVALPAKAVLGSPLQGRP